MKQILSIFAIAALIGCSSNDGAGTKASYESISTQGEVSGLGIESQDITAMTDKMIKSLLKTPVLVNRSKPARIIIDSEYFTNESTSRINKNLLTDRIRINLSMNAKGKISFVSRENAMMVEKERELKRDGAVDGGTIRTTQAQAGADFRLTGRISSLDSVNTDNQQSSRYHQIIFEIVDLELGTIVWSELYEFKKSAQDNIRYR